MSTFFRSWVIQLPEPDHGSFPKRIEVQASFIAERLAPWILTGKWQRHTLHSFHLMRYVDAQHLPFSGIVLVFRVLGTEKSLISAAPPVREFLANQERSGRVQGWVEQEDGDWEKSVLAEYGGPGVADAWARFLAASTHLSLLLNGHRDGAEVAPDAVYANWQHCFSLICRGTG